jgi:hypothetical protein
LAQLLLPADPSSQQQQQQQLELSESSRSTAVALVLQFVSAGLVSLQQAVQALCVRPLQLLWQLGWGYAGGGSSSNIRLLLLLVQELLAMVPVQPKGVDAACAASPTPSAAAAAARVGQQLGLDADLSACACPLTCPAVPAWLTRTTAAAAAAAATGPVTVNGTQDHQELSSPPAATAGAAAAAAATAADDGLKWLLLGVCRAQLLLQEQCFAAHRPDFRGSAQAAAVLEALVAAAGCDSMSLSVEEWQQLSWQQRLLLWRLVSSSALVAYLQPASLQQQQQLPPADGSNAAAAAAAAAAATGASLPALLLDCCKLAAVSDAAAVSLAAGLFDGVCLLANGHHIASLPQPPAVPPAAANAGSGLPAALVGVTSALAAAVRSAASSRQAAKQGLAMALGQFLPWAAGHEAGRVLLRLAPALLATPAMAPVNIQQQQQQQQQWGAGAVGDVWTSVVQVTCKAVVLFLLHGKWPSTAAAQQGSTGGGPPAAAAAAAAAVLAAGGMGDVGAAKQLAAEQCFRHVSLLLVHIMGSTDSTQQQQQQQEQQQQGAEQGSDAGGVSGADAAAAAAAGAGVQLRLLQACVSELCGLIVAVSGQFDCSVLQAVLLQLLTQLCGLIGRGTLPAGADTAAAAGAGGDAAEGAEAAVAGDSTAAAGNEQAAVGVGKAWEGVLLPDGVTSCGVLLGWVGGQVLRLPQQLQQLVGPGVVHVVEQQLAGVLKRQLTDAELEAVEESVVGA